MSRIKPKKILHICTSDIKGGASIAAYRLHCDLLNAGYDSHMLVQEKFSGEESVIPVWQKFSHHALGILANKVEGILAQKIAPPADCMWAFNLFSSSVLKHIDTIAPDIVNLHWVNRCMLSLRDLAKISYPLVWTLHDLWPISPGYHYLGEFLEQSRKSANPEKIDEFGLNFWTRRHLRKKKLALDKKKITFVAPSRWLQKCIENSEVASGHKVANIPYSVPADIFKPADKAFARDRFNLPTKGKLVLFGSEFSSTDMRKGIDLFLSAIREISTIGKKSKNNSPNSLPGIVVFGSSRQSSTSAKLNLPADFKYHFVGRLSDPVTLSLLYAACDCFVCPSREDNLPNTALEALACNLPVVGFDIGGLPDMVSHKKNGYIAKALNTKDLAGGISWALKSFRQNDDLKNAPRETVLTKFNSAKQVESYLKVYQELLSS